MRRWVVLFVLALLAVAVQAKPSAGVRQVRPGRQYELSYRARVVKGPTIEEHPEYADLVSIAVSRPTVTGIRFGAVNWTFLSADGKKVARPHEGGQPVTLFSREWRSFVERVWIPEGVAAIRVDAVPGAKGDRVEVADAAVRELPDDGTLFSTSEFGDEYAPSGWKLVGAAQYLTDGKGRGFVSTEAGHANSEVFPVVPGERVRVKLRGSVSPRADRPQFNCWMHFAVDYSATRAAKGFRKSLVPLTIGEGRSSAEREFEVPEGMTWARVSVWNGELRGIEITRR